MPTINDVTNISGAPIFIDGFGVIGPAATENLPDNAQVAELIAAHALSTTGPVITDPSKRAVVRARVGYDESSEFLIDLTDVDDPDTDGRFIGVDGLPHVAVPPDIATDDEVLAAIAAIGGRYRGTYAGGTSYKANDLVTQAGALYSRNTPGTPAGAFTGAEWTLQLSPGAQALARTAVKTAAYTASPGDLVPVDASGGPVPIALPSSPGAKARVAVKLVAVAGGNACTITAAAGDVFNKAGGSASLTLALLNQGVSLQYDAGVWTVISTDVPLSALDARYPQKSTNPADAGKVIDAYTGLPVSSGSSVDADATTKGVVKLAGDLGGTAAAPTVPGLATKRASTFSDAELATIAASPDLLVTGAITRDSNAAATAASVTWPDGATGAYASTTVSTAFPGAVDAYTVTHVLGGTTKTFTQPAVTRDSTTGAVTTRPAITVA